VSLSSPRPLSSSCPSFSNGKDGSRKSYFEIASTEDSFDLTNSAERIENYSKRLAARHVEITMLRRYNFASTLDVVGGSFYNVKSFRISSKCPPWTPISAKSEHVILINAQVSTLYPYTVNFMCIKNIIFLFIFFLSF